MCYGVNILYIITLIYKHVQKQSQQILVCSLGIRAMHMMDSCLVDTNNFPQWLLICPSIPVYGKYPY